MRRNTGMKFRLQYSTRGFEVFQGQVMEIQTEDSHEVLVRIEPVGDKSDGMGTRATCIATGRFTFADSIESMFQDLAARRVPRGFRHSPERYKNNFYITPDGSLKEGTIPPWDMLPEELETSIREVHVVLRSRIQQVIDLFRWRHGSTTGAHSPLWHSHLEWAQDEVEWHPLTPDFFMEVGKESTTSPAPPRFHNVCAADGSERGVRSSPLGNTKGSKGSVGQ